MQPAQAALAQRLRQHLDGLGALREIAMFGGRAFMLDDRMLACALGQGGLLVRCDPERHDELLTRTGARQAEMGKGRTMGAGWVEVGAEALDDDAALGAWLDEALARHRVAAR